MRPRRVGPGSDLDLVLIAADDSPFERRALRWDLTGLPVPVDVLVYTPVERQRHPQSHVGKRAPRYLAWVVLTGEADGHGDPDGQRTGVDPTDS